MRHRLILNWQLGQGEAEPAAWIPACVPGAVQLDWAAAQGWSSHTWNVEPVRYAGLEDQRWWYTADLPERTGDGWWLCLEGVDHLATVLLDGVAVARTRGFLVPCAVPVPATARRVTVVLDPAPKEAGTKGRDRARRSTKAAVSYGWDFHPELIPLGIAGGAWLERRPAHHLIDLSWRAQPAADLSTAAWQVTVAATGGTVHCTLIDPDGAVVADGEAAICDGTAVFAGTLATPRLWWPAGQGLPERYRLRCTLGEDVIERQVGIRSVALEMSPGQWDEPSTFPKSRSLPPMVLTVNGRRVFAKGANIVGLDIFPGSVTEARLREQVEQAAAAHMNVLRVWGGAQVPREAFYDACDELGILVVQEFPLACNRYPDDSTYLAELEDAGRALITRLARRPCLALWSGGNELFNAWSGMTDQAHPLRLLASLCWQLDRHTPFVPTLPVEGVGHGSYLFRDPRTGVECFALFQQSDGTAYTEFSVPGAADPEVIRAIVPADEVWPPRTSGAWKMHAGSEAWDVEPTSYLCLSTIEHYWGPRPGLDDVVARSQWLQCTGLQSIIEEARRQRPRCGWAVAWCLNEPWPTVANQSLLSYPCRPKPALAAVTAAMRPTLASARLARFQWRPGDLFAADLWLLHDAPAPRPGATVRVGLRSGGWSAQLLDWSVPPGPRDADLPGPTVRCRLPDTLGDELLLDLTVEGHDWSSTYRLATRLPTATEAAQGPRGLNA